MVGVLYWLTRSYRCCNTLNTEQHSFLWKKRLGRHIPVQWRWASQSKSHLRDSNESLLFASICRPQWVCAVYPGLSVNCRQWLLSCCCHLTLVFHTTGCVKISGLLVVQVEARKNRTSNLKSRKLSGFNFVKIQHFCWRLMLKGTNPNWSSKQPISVVKLVFCPWKGFGHSFHHLVSKLPSRKGPASFAWNLYGRLRC